MLHADHCVLYDAVYFGRHASSSEEPTTSIFRRTLIKQRRIILPLHALPINAKTECK